MKIFKRNMNHFRGDGYNLVAKKQTYAIRLFSLLTLCVAIFCGAVFASSYKKNVDAMSNTASSATIENVGEILMDGYASSDKKFNAEALQKLYSLLTGNASATYSSLNDLFTNSAVTLYSSPIIQHSTLKTNAGNKNIVVKFGGFEWTVTSLTKDKTGNKVLLTMWLSNSSQLKVPKIQFTPNNINDKKLTYPSAMYSSSRMRVEGLNAGHVYTDSKGIRGYGNAAGTGLVAYAQKNDSEWSKFTCSPSATSLTDYIVRPTEVAYQETQNFVLQSQDTGSIYILPSESYGVPAPSTIRYNNNDSAYGENLGNSKVSVGYNDWQYDYLWLPSMTESRIDRTNNLWGVSDTEVTADGKYPTAFRTGAYGSAHTMQAVDANGNYKALAANSEFAIRPALHLNLTKAEEDSSYRLTVPQNVTGITYDGTSKYIDSLGSSAPSWITSGHYDNNIVSTKVLFTGYKGDGSRIAQTDITSSCKGTDGLPDIIDAGDYLITLTLTDNSYIWDGKNSSVREQTFSITIPQKQVTLGQQLTVNEFGLETNSSLSFASNDIFAHDSGDLAPTLGLKYRLSTSPAGTETTSVPNTPGTYVATAYLKNSGQCNYKLSGSSNESTTFTLAKERIAVPYLASGQDSKPYNGSTQTFAMQSWDSRITIVLQKKDGNGNWINTSDASVDTTNGELSAKKAGEYRAELKIDSSVYDWGTTSALTAQGTVTQYVEFEIAPKKLTLTLTNDNPDTTSPWSWQFGSSVTAQLTASGISGSDSVSFTLFYYKSTETSSQKQGSSTSAANGNAGEIAAEITLGASVPTGGYYISAELYAGVGENDNYELDLTGGGLPKLFSVGAQMINENALQWKISSDGGVNFQPIADNGTVKYRYKAGTTTPVDYLVKVDDSGFGSTYACEIDTTAAGFTNGYQNNTQSGLGQYTTTAALKTTNSDVTFSNGSDAVQISIHWEIVTGDIDYGSIVWEFKIMNSQSWNDYNPAKPPEYANGKYIQVRIKESTLPAGISYSSSFSLTGNQQRNIGNYKAQMTSADLDCDPGFGTIDFTNPAMSLNWEITKKSIPAVWDRVNHVNNEQGGIDYKVPEIKDLSAIGLQPNQIIYKYYDEQKNQITLEDIDRIAKQTNATIANGGILRFTVEAILDPSISDNYMFGDGTSSTITEPFIVGSGNFIASVNFESDREEYDGTAQFTKFTVTNATDGTILMPGSDYEVKYYAGKVADPAKLLTGAPTAAGEYLVVLELINGMDGMYTLNKSEIQVTIDKKIIAVPTIKEGIQFNGTEQQLSDLLNGYDGTLAELSGDISARKAGNYTAIVKLKDAANYEWETPAAVATGKTGVSKVIRLANASAGEIELPWSIGKVVLTPDWDMTGETPVLKSFAPYAGIADVGLEYLYYADATAVAPLENVELKGGDKYYVTAALTGEDADNFIFADTQDTVTEKVEYTVPSSGFAAAMSSAVNFAKENWWWLLLILAGLLFLILLIVLIKRHNRKKEEKRRLEEAKREEELRNRLNVPVSAQMPVSPMMSATAQPQPMPQAQLQQQQLQTQPAPAPIPATVQNAVQPAPQVTEKPKPKKKSAPSGMYIQGYVPTANGMMPIKIRVKKKGSSGDFPLMPVPYGNQYPMGMGQMPMMGSSMGYQGYPQPQYGMDMRPVEVRIAEEKARMAEARMNSKLEADLRIAEERARKSESGINSELMTLLIAAMRGMGLNDSAREKEKQLAPQQPPQPIFITNPQAPTQPILITNQQPPITVKPSASSQGQRSDHYSISGEDSLETSQDAGFSDYDDGYGYDTVYESLNDKNN